LSQNDKETDAEEEKTEEGGVEVSKMLPPDRTRYGTNSPMR